MIRDEKHLSEKFGLGVFRFPVINGDSFKFGDAEVVEVQEKAVRPVGIMGNSGVLEMSIIPGADTPLLVAKNDMAALGTLVGLGNNKALVCGPRFKVIYSNNLYPRGLVPR